MTNVTLTPEQVTRYERGERTGVALARELGCHPHSVYEALRREGVAVRRRGRQPAVSDESVAGLVADVRGGRRSIVSVARELGQSRFTARAALRRQGLPPLTPCLGGKARQAAELRAEGLSYREIGRRLNVSRQRAHQLVARAATPAAGGTGA